MHLDLDPFAAAVNDRTLTPGACTAIMRPAYGCRWRPSQWTSGAAPTTSLRSSCLSMIRSRGRFIYSIFAPERGRRLSGPASAPRGYACGAVAGSKLTPRTSARRPQPKFVVRAYPGIGAEDVAGGHFVTEPGRVPRSQWRVLVSSQNRFGGSLRNLRRPIGRPARFNAFASCSTLELASVPSNERSSSRSRV